MAVASVAQITAISVWWEDYGRIVGGDSTKDQPKQRLHSLSEIQQIAWNAARPQEGSEGCEELHTLCENG